MCPRRASQAYQPETAASLRAALAGESPGGVERPGVQGDVWSSLASWSGSTLAARHQANQDGARLARCWGVMPRSRA